MFERFSERARQAVVMAQREAVDLRSRAIGTEHILLGLLRVEDGLAARVLTSVGVEIEQVRSKIREVGGEGAEAISGQIPFTPYAKKVLELALREALSLGHNYVGTEHILLGLGRLNQGVAAEILAEVDADPEKIRNALIRPLNGPGGRRWRDPPTSGRDARPARTALAKGLPDATLACAVGDLVNSQQDEQRALLVERIDAAMSVLSLEHLLDALGLTKEGAIADGEFERAAKVRDTERKLIMLIRDLPPHDGPDESSPTSESE